jgi:hypothetical protein
MFSNTVFQAILKRLNSSARNYMIKFVFMLVPVEIQ